jgi:hypothetical protein
LLNCKKYFMPWSCDVVIFTLFPYLLPSVPIVKEECWSKKFRRVLEYLLMSFCGFCFKKKQKCELMRFLKQIFPAPSYKPSLCDLHFVRTIFERDLPLIKMLWLYFSNTKLMLVYGNIGGLTVTLYHS